MNVLANQGLALPGKNLMHFLLSKGLSSVICLGFGVWGTQGSGGQVGRVIIVLRPFPELVWRSVQNLAEIDTVVCTWKGDTGTYIGTKSLFYTYRYGNTMFRHMPVCHMPVCHMPICHSRFAIWASSPYADLPQLIPHTTCTHCYARAHPVPQG